MTSGTDIIRLALHQRNKNPQAFARIAADAKVAKEVLARFLDGTGTLTPEVKVALAREFFDGAGFDPTRDLLTKPPRPEPRSYVTPPVVDPEQFPDRWGPWHVGGVQLPPAPDQPKRQGWQE